MAKARRIDANQNKIVKLLGDLGATVLILSHVGKGCPDLLIGVNGCNILIELKDGSKSPSARRLTPCQEKFFDEWKGQVCIVATVDDAIDLINRVRMRIIR